ncbi:MAG: ATP-binding cassette domain-containing protein [Gemmatimonadota bacterium]|nr:ATP-binding cassette domain-containing protein [Gemmatimonadota bacterium]
MNNDSIVLDNLTFSYPGQPGQPVLESLCARIPLSGNTLILGANGAGKTTLARLLSSLDTPTGGTITWPGMKHREQGVRHEAPQAGVVFENPDFQFHTFIVREELTIGLRYCGASSAECSRALERCSDLLGLGPLFDKPLQELEVPEQLAVLVAGFRILDPRLLVIDFSFSVLESAFRRALLDSCREDCGPALVVLSRHAVDLAHEGFDSNVFILEEGRRLAPVDFRADRPEIAGFLERARIRLPWYAHLAAALKSEGFLQGGIFYEHEDDFKRQVKDLAPGG